MCPGRHYAIQVPPRCVSIVGLQRSEQKELLHQIVAQVVVNFDGDIQLELRAPFAYLKALSDEIRSLGTRNSAAYQMQSGKQNGERNAPAVPKDECSNLVLSS